MSKQRVENIQNKALLIRTKMATLAAMSVPRSAIAERDENGTASAVLVWWDLPNMQMCADLGMPVLSPMIRDYEFIGKHKPYRHQLLICSHLTVNKRAFCFADMGTGKSLAVVHSIRYLLSIGAIKRALIIAPLSTLSRTWEDEFFNVDPSLEVTKLYGTKAKRIKLASNNAPVHIINFDGIPTIHNEIKANNYDCVVIDEVTAYSNHQSKRWKEAVSLFKDTKYLWGLTGTPIVRGVTLAYGQAKLVTPHSVRFRSFTEFRNVVQQKVSDFVWIDRPEAHGTAFSILSPAISIKKEDCIDLPPLVRVYREVELSAGQRSFYAKLREEKFVKDEQTQVSAVNPATLSGKLLQVSSGCLYDDDGQILEFDVQSRIEETVSLVQKARSEASSITKGKALVLAPYRHTVDMLKRKLQEQKIVVDGKERKLSVAAVHGGVPPKKRDEIYKRFDEDATLDIIIAIPETMSHGLTMVSASCVVWFAPCANAESFVQACNRVNRPGQTESMVIAHLYGSQAEWNLYKNLIELKRSEDCLLSFYKDVIRGL